MRRGRAVGVGHVDIGQRLTADEHADALADGLDPHLLPFARLRMKAEGAHAHQLVGAHVALAHEVDLVDQSALHAHHIAVEA